MLNGIILTNSAEDEGNSEIRARTKTCKKEK